MADKMWGKIKVGGDLKRTDLKRFCCVANNVQEAEFEGFFEDGRFVLEDEEAENGMFDYLEDLCQELGLTYVRWSDGKYEVMPEISWWKPGMADPGSVLCDSAHNMLVPEEYVRAVRDLLVAGYILSAIAKANGLAVDLPEVPPFRVVD